MNTGPQQPEQWFVVIDDIVCVSTAGEKSLMELQDNEFIDCNSSANARLIAAAPELLQALEMLVSWEDTGAPVSDVCFAHAHSAIAKAKRGH